MIFGSSFGVGPCLRYIRASVTAAAKSTFDIAQSGTIRALPIDYFELLRSHIGKSVTATSTTQTFDPALAFIKLVALQPNISSIQSFENCRGKYRIVTTT